jgi:hypothetical protein
MEAVTGRWELWGRLSGEGRWPTDLEGNERVRGEWRRGLQFGSVRGSIRMFGEQKLPSEP